MRRSSCKPAGRDKGDRDRGVHARAAVPRAQAGVRRRRRSPTNTASRVREPTSAAVSVEGRAPDRTAAPWRLADVAAGARMAGARPLRSRASRRPAAMTQPRSGASIGNGAHRRAGRSRAGRDRLGVLPALRRRSRVLLAAARARADDARTSASSPSTSPDFAHAEQAYLANTRDPRHAPVRPARRQRSRSPTSRRASAQYGRMFRPMMLVRRSAPHCRQPAHAHPGAARSRLRRAAPHDVTLRQQPHPLRRARTSSSA